MDPGLWRDQLARHAIMIEHLVRPLTSEQARWKPTPDDWSVLEVVNHLADEEREDFRLRVKMLMSGSSEQFPPINPPQAVIDRHYNGRDPVTSLEDYLAERDASLSWLAEMEADGIDWTRAYTHPPLEGIRLGDLMVSWAAHDVLHMRQLVELIWAYQQTQLGGFDTRYAGDW